MRIGLIGDFNGTFEPHRVTERTLKDAVRELGTSFEACWVPTADLTEDPAPQLEVLDGIWISPGSPYRNMEGVLRAIQYTREHRVPTFGSCAGFQHVVLELARNLLARAHAHSTEYDANAEEAVITLPACTVAGETMHVELAPASRAAQLYGSHAATERYYCRFALNEAYRDPLSRVGVRFSGWDRDRMARIVELPDHPFFLATLFVPGAAKGAPVPHPVVLGFVRAAFRHAVAPTTEIL